MAELPLDEAVQRFHGNEERINKFVNAPGGEDSFETSEGAIVPVLPRMIEAVTLQAEIATQEAQKAVSAKDSSFSNADLFETVEAGIDPSTGVALGEQFQVLLADGSGYQRYRHDPGPVATPLPGSHPSLSKVRQIANEVGSTAARTQTLRRLPLGPSGRNFAISIGDHVVLEFDENGRLITDHSHSDFAAADHTHLGLEIPTKKLPKGSLNLRWGVAIGKNLAFYVDGEGRLHSYHEHPELRTKYLAELTGTAPNRIGYINDKDSGRRYLLAGTDVHDISVDGSTVTYKSDEGFRYVTAENISDPGPVIPNPRLVFCGDSLTVSWGGNAPPPGTYGENWPVSVVAPALGLTSGTDLFNLAESGSASSDIALKLGAIQPVVTVSGNTIPETGAVTASVISPVTGFRGGAGFSFVGTLAGVAGSLAHDGAGNWTFSRTSPGNTVIVPEGSTFVSDKASLHESDVIVFFAGRNNVYSSTFADDVLRDAKSVETFLRPLIKRFLVVSVTNGRYEGYGQAEYIKILDCNARLAEAFGDRFVDVRAHLFENGLEAAGLTPTQADLDNIAAGRMPPSLMRDGTDSIHFNPAAYAVIGNYIIDAGLAANGWFSRI